MPETKSTPRLTDARIAKLPTTGKKYDTPDSGCRGLVVTVAPGGGRSFRWHIHVDGKSTSIVLGPWVSPEPRPGHLTLREAQSWLARLKAAKRAGREAFDREVAALDDALGRERRPVAGGAPRAAGDTVGALADAFFRERIAGGATPRKNPAQALDVLEKDILPRLGKDRPLKSITTRDLADVVRDAANTGRRGKPARTWAKQVHGVLKQMFRWAAANGIIPIDPSAPLTDAKALGVAKNVRKRALAPDEIAPFWHAVSLPEREAVPVTRTRNGKPETFMMRPIVIAPSTQHALKLILLLGCRPGELVKARWENVDLDAGRWTIPVADQKVGDQPFRIPVPPLAVESFKALKAAAGASPYVLASPRTHDGRTSTTAIGHALSRLFADGTLVLPGGPVKPHDLRRSCRTGLARLKVPPHVAKRCLNHAYKGENVDEVVYDHHDYYEERAEALARWAGYVEAKVRGGMAEVVPLVRAAS